MRYITKCKFLKIVQSITTIAKIANYQKIAPCIRKNEFSSQQTSKKIGSRPTAEGGATRFNFTFYLKIILAF